jgi:hypothetical protein
MSSDSRDIVYSAFFLGFGVWSFFKGFKRLNEKRLIENIPTSTVRGLAMGLVELAGKARKTKTMATPLSGTECVFYRYTVERYESSGRSGRWVVIARGDSDYCPFYLDDGTGTVTVLPRGAETIMPADYNFETGLGTALPGHLADFMEGNNLAYKGILGNYSLRFKEWFIVPDDSVFVLGTAQKTAGTLTEHQEKLVQRLEQLKGDSQKIAEADLNKDGILSEDEWGRVVAGVEQKLLEEELASKSQDDLADVIVGKGDAGQVFIISDESQKQITEGLSWQVFAGVFGGAALSLAMLAYLLFRFGMWTKS